MRSWVQRAVVASMAVATFGGCAETGKGADVDAERQLTRKRGKATRLAAQKTPKIGEGIIKLQAADFAWSCAVHRPASATVHIPKGGEHEHMKHREAAKLARDLVHELQPTAKARIFQERAVGATIASGLRLLRDVGPYKESERVILFSAREYVEHIKRTGTTDTVAYVFAHELGHVAKGDDELEADFYAGVLLGKRGTTLEHTTAWLREHAPAQGSDLDKRLAAITRGWNQGCADSKKCADPITPSNDRENR